jgi:hypothetical protein
MTRYFARCFFNYASYRWKEREGTRESEKEEGEEVVC